MILNRLLYSSCRPLFGVLFLGLYLLFISKAHGEERTLCSDIRYLVDQSESGFADIVADKDAGPDGGNSDFSLPEADVCVVFNDYKRISYKCSWEFLYGSEKAQSTFDRFKNDMDACLQRANRETDNPVNHPDFYAAKIYSSPKARVTVSYKNKSALAKTLVSIRIDGPASSQ